MRNAIKSTWTRPSLSQTGASHRLKLKGLNGGDTSLFLLHRGKRSLTFIISLSLYIYARSFSLRYLPLSLSLLSQSLLSVRRIILCWSALYVSAIRVFCRYACLACSLSLFLLAPALLEEGFVEVWRRMWVRQCGGFLRGFRGVS